MTVARASAAPTGDRQRLDPVDLGLLVRLAIALLTAIAVTVIAARTGDFWARPDEGAHPGLERNLVVARAVIFCGAFATVLLLPPALLRLSRYQRVALAGWTAYLGLWLAGQWPGLVEPDTTELVVQTRRGVAYEWFSWPQSLLNFVALDLVPHVAVLGVLQVTLMAALLAHVTWLVRQRSVSRWPALAFCALTALSAPLLSYSVHLVRDTMFAIGHVALALLVARIVVERQVGRTRLLQVAALTAAVSALRGDGPVLLVVVPGILLLALARGRPRAEIAGAAAAFVVAATLFHAVFPAMLSIRPENPHLYDFTLRLNPLGAVLQSDWYADDPDQVLADLSRVIDVEKIKAQQDAVNIPAYWRGDAWRADASEEDWRAFEGAATQLVIDNPATFAANRLRVFLASSGLGPGAYRGPEYVYPVARARVVRERVLAPADVVALTATPPSQRLYDAQQRFLHWSSDFRGVGLSGAAIHWNLIPWLLLLCVVALRFRRWRFEAVVAVIVLSRVPLVALVAPIAQFKYYNSLHLGGLVVLALLLSRLRPPAWPAPSPSASARPPAPLDQLAAKASTSPGVPSGTTAS